MVEDITYSNIDKLKDGEVVVEETVVGCGVCEVNIMYTIFPCVPVCFSSLSYFYFVSSSSKHSHSSLHIYSRLSRVEELGKARICQSIEVYV